jgi:RHS repeat-associated protein
VVTTTAQYDPAGRLTEWQHVQNSAGAEINRFTWTYDALGRPVTQSSADGSTTYQYDAASQVTAATHTSQTSESYQYDANGNRTNTGITTGGNNRLLSDDRYDYQYDGEGNRTRRTERATGKSEVLAWDHRNRLTSVTTFSATGTKLATVEYTYDVFDRRIARRVDADGNGVFETTQRFVYDGEDLILAFSGTTNILTNRYLYGPATDEILADEKITTGTAGTVTWSLGDNLGTIRDLVQYNAAAGTTTVVNHVRYDTFGQIVSQTNSQFQPWFAYTGREWDPAVGLYFYRARWYDPRAGRFTSEDPLGFAAGDSNLNRYVGNGATLWVDPSGMAMSDPYVPGFGGFTNEDYSNYLKAHEGIANLFADKDAIAEFLERNRLEREEFIDEYIDELYGPGRMDYIRKGLKDGLKELGYQVVLEVGTHYGSAGAGWIGGRILSWTAKRFKSMWSAWRGSRAVTTALKEGTEAATEQLSRASKGVPGPTPLRSHVAHSVDNAAHNAANYRRLRDFYASQHTGLLGPSDGLADLSRLRAQLGSVPGGGQINGGVVARLDAGGRSFYGINAHGQPTTLRANALTATHAEMDAFQQASNANMRGGTGRLFVDTELCKACGQNGGVRSLARQLGLDSLEIVTPSGTIIIFP